jgi:hypothetical protein
MPPERSEISLSREKISASSFAFMAAPVAAKRWE